jgi:alpha-tubulin suppressor-like RCC1 family protein
MNHITRYLRTRSGIAILSGSILLTLLAILYVHSLAAANTVQIAAGNSFTCTLANGRVRCWGYGSSTGTNSTASRPLPFEVSGITNGVQLAASGGHACAVLEGGGAVCWGSNEAGQLGDGSTTQGLIPVSVAGLAGNVQQMGLGFSHSCALMASSGVQCWGLNANGQVGNGVTPFENSYTTPQTVVGLTGVKKVVGGGAHSCALLNDGSIKCWGYGFYGQLGNGLSGNEADTSTPVSVVSLGGKAVDLAAGYHSTCAALEDGRVRCWGEIGDIWSSKPVNAPGFSSGYRQISMGAAHVCGLDVYGNAACLGLATGPGSNTAVPINGLGTGVRSITSGHYHACAERPGEMMCWGSDYAGELGDGTFTRTDTPWAVLAFGGQSMRDVSVSGNYACAVDAAGKAFCWGLNNGGNLGIGDDNLMSTYSLPQMVSGLNAGVTQISAGTHACAVANGGAKCWGRNDYGQLVVGTGTYSSAAPMQVVGLTSGVSKISVTKAADNPHTCAVVNGSAQCWGMNYSGQLGLGYWDANNVYTPGQVVGLTSGVSDIASGGDHSCAVVSGAAKCWGFSYYGQLGNDYPLGTYDKFASPVQVYGLTGGVSGVAAGRDFSCALVGGSAKCWGRNQAGQLGNGVTTNSATPVQVSGLTSGVTTLTLGDTSACALKNQAVWCWGSGFGTAPVLVNGISEVTGLSHSQGVTCAMQATGLACWGHDTYGELGDGRIFERAQPGAVVGFGPQAQISLNETRARAGSVLHLVGVHLPANSEGWLEANGSRLGDLRTDGAGQFTAVLLTSGASAGYYPIRAVVGIGSAQTELTIDNTAPVFAQQGGGGVYALTPGSAGATPWPSATPRPTASPAPGTIPTATAAPSQIVINSVIPSQGDRFQNTTIHISGSNFRPGAVIKLDNQIAALTTTYEDAWHLSAVLPGGLAEKAYDVVVINPDWNTGSLGSGYLAQTVSTGTTLLYGYDYELISSRLEEVVGEATQVRFVVHSQGGAASLSNVPVRFYVGAPGLSDPATQASLIGDGVIPSLAPNQSVGVSKDWTPGQAGEFELYAVINPLKAEAEKNITKKFYQNWVKVKPSPPPAGSDRLPPVVDAASAPLTASGTTHITVQAHDVGPAGMAWVDFVVYEYFPAAQAWLATDETGWMPYSEGTAKTYSYDFGYFSGPRWIDVWAADAAKNVSLKPKSVVTNYVKPNDFILQGESQLYLFPMPAGDAFQANMSMAYPDNDADLYLWPPDYPGRLYWVSAKAGNAAEAIAVTAPVGGYYWLEVYGYGFAFYNLTAGVGLKQDVFGGEGPLEGEAKPPRSTPPSAAGNWPTSIYRLSDYFYRAALPLLSR